MRKVFVPLILVLAMVFSCGLSFAQHRGGDIYGSVVLADGSRIPGVLITVSGDNIGQKTTLSSEKGNFRFISLPPGTYTLRFELQGFTTVIRKDIQVRLGKTSNLNVLLETSTIQEEITVSQKARIIDTRKTEVSVNVTKEMVESIPTARNPWTVLSSLPGVMVDRLDVGGADSGQQSNFIAGGGDQDDTTWNVDGANITDPSAIGAAPAYLNVNSYDEVQVTLGANDITAQTGGIQVNFVTKRSGNKTSGDFHLYVEDKAWEMSQDPTQEMIDNDLVIPGIDRLYMYGVNLGGPLIKNKLWWFGSWGIQDIHKRTETGEEDATWLVSGYGKINFQLGNTSGDFQLSHDAKKKWGRTILSSAQQDGGSLRDQDGPGNYYYAGLNHIFGNLMLNAKIVYSDGGFELTPRGSTLNSANGNEEGGELKIVDGWSRLEGSAWHYITNRNSLNMSLSGNYFLEGAIGGDHEIKFGVDYYSADTTTQYLTPNQRIAYVYRDDPSSNYLQITPNYISDLGFNRISAYVQDTATFGRLTASFGIRYDKESGKVNPFMQPGFTWYEPDSPHHGEQMFSDIINPVQTSGFDAAASWDIISPRISLTYDLTGDGKNVIKLAVGRYMSQSGNSIAGNYIPYRYGFAEWTDLNGDEVPQYNEVGGLTFTDPFVQTDAETGMNRIAYADDYNTPYLDELTLSFEKALTEDLAVSVTGMYKKKHNLVNDVNSRGEIGAVSRGIMADGSLETKANWQQTGTEMVGGTEVPVFEQIETPVGNQFYNLDKAYDRYMGIQFGLVKKLSDKWMANLSFTYQDWKHFRFEEETLDMNNFDFFNEGTVAPATQGSGIRDLWVNSRWMVKLTGMYQLPWGLNFTGFFQAREGYPQPLRRLVRLSMGTRYLYRAGYKAGDERLPTLWILNLGLEKTLKISDTVTATLVVDWYNATNNQTVLKRDLSIGETAPGEPDATMWSNAGLFQFGVRVNF